LHKPYEIQVAFFVISAVRAHYGKNKASSKNIASSKTVAS
jgi:hypothetical protein